MSRVLTGLKSWPRQERCDVGPRARRHLVAPILAVVLASAAACVAPAPEAPPAPAETAEPAVDAGRTIFQVYNLGEVCAQPLSEQDLVTFLAMVRDAVGEDVWYEHASSARTLQGVLTVRTTPSGQNALQQFFTRFRGISTAKK